MGPFLYILSENQSLLKAFVQKYDVPMLDSIFDNFSITLLFRCCCEALDASYCVVNKVINKVLIDDLLFVDELSGKSDDDL